MPRLNHERLSPQESFAEPKRFAGRLHHERCCVAPQGNIT
jgi:hypothetical protein